MSNDVLLTAVPWRTCHIYRGYNNHDACDLRPGEERAQCAERGIPFSLVKDFDWSAALVAEDTRRDYGERRFQAIGFIGERLHVLVFTPRDQDVHVISLRRANERERNRYAAQTKS